MNTYRDTKLSSESYFIVLPILRLLKGDVRRYEKSRSPTVGHLPNYSGVSSFHVMADNSSLLSASIQYGIVARSQLLTGGSSQVNHHDRDNLA